MKAIVETPRTIMRAFVEDDLPTFFELGSNPEIIRYTADPGGGFRDIDHAREALFDAPIADYAKYGYGRFAVVHREDDRVIGFCGLKYLEEFDEADLGYRYLPDYWGQGLATETAGAAMNWGFGHLELEQMIALTAPENVASIRVLEKLGMEQIGTIDYSGVQACKFAIQRENYRLRFPDGLPD